MILNTITVGTNQDGFTVARRFADSFTYSTDCIVVFYYEFLLVNGKELEKVKKEYIVINYPDNPMVTRWVERLDRAPIAADAPGIVDSIEATLAALPIGFRDGGILPNTPEA